MKTIAGLIIASLGFTIYNAALRTIKNQLMNTGQREMKLVFILILGIVFSALGGIFIGYDFLTIS